MNPIRKWMVGVLERRSVGCSFAPPLHSSTTRLLQSRRAYSLIQLIGVLAVIAILAAILVPDWVRQMDKTVGASESAALKSFADALQQSIMRYRYIPNDTDWASAV